MSAPPTPDDEDPVVPEANGVDVPGRAGPRSVCPDADTLAVFVDRQLDETNRRRVVNHIARCPECYEVVADSLHFVGLGGAAGRRTLETEEAEDDARADDQGPRADPLRGAEAPDAPPSRSNRRARSWSQPVMAVAALLMLVAGLWRARVPTPAAPRIAHVSPQPSPPVAPSPASSPSASTPRSPDAPVRLEPALEMRLEDWQVRRQSAFGANAFSRPCALAVGALSAVAAEARGANTQIEALAAWPAWGLRGCADDWRALAAEQVRRVGHGQALAVDMGERGSWVRLGYDLEAWSAWSRSCTGQAPNSAGLRAARALLDGHPVQPRLDAVIALAEEATPWSVERCRRASERVSDLRAILLN